MPLINPSGRGGQPAAPGFLLCVQTFLQRKRSGLPKNLCAADGALMPSRARFCRRKTARSPAPKRPEK